MEMHPPIDVLSFDPTQTMVSSMPLGSLNCYRTCLGGTNPAPSVGQPTQFIFQAKQPLNSRHDIRRKRMRDASQTGQLEAQSEEAPSVACIGFQSLDSGFLPCTTKPCISPGSVNSSRIVGKDLITDLHIDWPSQFFSIQIRIQSFSLCILNIPQKQNA